MKVRHLFAVCVASMVWSGVVTPSVLACEKCDREHVCSGHCQSDDRGLLDRIDSALMRRQPRLPQGCLPQLPSLRGTFQASLLGHCCAGPSCGCEVTQASCGCEMAAASCGVERAGGPGHSEAQWHSESHVGSQPAVPSVHSDPSSFQPPAFKPRPQPVETLQEIPQVQPLPQRMPVEMVPRPDSEHDPFRDDSVRALRRVPAQSVQLRPSQRAYRQSYDPQASHESVRISLSDQELPNQRQMQTRLSQLPRTGLDEQRSSRQGNIAPVGPPNGQQPLPAVVTASGLSRADSRDLQRQPEAGYNPLRSSR